MSVAVGVELHEESSCYQGQRGFLHVEVQLVLTDLDRPVFLQSDTKQSQLGVMCAGNSWQLPGP